MSAGLSDAEWTREVLTALETPLREVGMGDPGLAPGRYVMWHADGYSVPRPCANSQVWVNSGGSCYDVTVREDADLDGTPILDVSTEGSGLVHQQAPDNASDLGTLLRTVAASIAQAIHDDFARFEADNAGFLPGTEPTPTSFADLESPQDPTRPDDDVEAGPGTFVCDLPPLAAPSWDPDADA